MCGWPWPEHGTQHPPGFRLLGSTYIAREKLNITSNLQQTLTVPPPRLTTQGEQVPAANQLWATSLCSQGLKSPGPGWGPSAITTCLMHPEHKKWRGRKAEHRAPRQSRPDSRGTGCQVREISKNPGCFSF